MNNISTDKPTTAIQQAQELFRSWQRSGYAEEIDQWLREEAAQDKRTAAQALEGLESGDTRLALEYFSCRAMKLERSFDRRQAAEAYCRLAALKFLEDPEAALAVYRKASALDSDNAEATARVKQLSKRLETK